MLQLYCSVWNFALEIEYSLNMGCNDGVKAACGLQVLQYCLDMGFKEWVLTGNGSRDEVQT